MGTDLLAALRALALPHASAHARDVLLQLLRSADRPPAEVVDLAARRRG